MFNLVARWPGSGLRQQEYCKRAGISVPAFTYWRNRFLRSEKPADFVPVSIGPDSAALIEICYPGGVVVRLNGKTTISEMISLITLDS